MKSSDWWALNFIKLILFLLFLPDFRTKNVWICDNLQNYDIILYYGGDYSKWSNFSQKLFIKILLGALQKFENEANSPPVRALRFYVSCLPAFFFFSAFFSAFFSSFLPSSSSSSSPDFIMDLQIAVGSAGPQRLQWAALDLSCQKICQKMCWKYVKKNVKRYVQ